MSEDPGSTSVEIAVVVRDRLWRAADPRIEACARRAAEAVFAHPGLVRDLGGAVEVSLVLADDAMLSDLNRTYRRQDRPTNVLAFATEETPAGQEGHGGHDGHGGHEGPRLLGDVILARETVLREAEDQGKHPRDHLSHLVVHGLLHLLGHDHETPRQAAEMEALEVSILAGLGIADPYREAPLEIPVEAVRS